MIEHIICYILISVCILSYFISLILIIIKYTNDDKYYEKNEFECLKNNSILYTYQNLVKKYNNFSPYLEINNNFLIDLQMTYDDLIKNSSKSICNDTLKKCGILDSYGNILCIKNIDPCPINEIIIDNAVNEYKYLENGYYSTNFYLLPEYKKLFYTNKSVDKKIITNIQLNYLNKEDIYIYNNDSIDNDDIYNYLIYKISNDININNFYENIYDNIYINNYIGFENYDYFNNFINADFNELYNKRFPNKICFIFSCIVLVLTTFLLISSIIIITKLKITLDELLNKNIIFWLSLSIIIELLGFYIYFIYEYYYIYSNHDLIEISKIKSDENINDLIKEFLSKFENKSIVTCIISLINLSISCALILMAYKPLKHSYLNRLEEKKRYEKFE